MMCHAELASPPRWWLGLRPPRAYVDFLAIGGLSGGLLKHTTGTSLHGPHLSATLCGNFATAGHRPKYRAAKGRTTVCACAIMRIKGEKRGGFYGLLGPLF